MTNTENISSRPNLAAYLADAPNRGFSVNRRDAVSWLLLDAYGDGSTDEVVTITGNGLTYDVKFGL